MADTPPGETVTPEAPSNEPGTTTAPVLDNSSADVEAAKREAEQARMRANQLENELKKVREAQEAADRQKLEETQEYKALYEKTEAQLKEMRDTQERAERETQLKTATDSVFKDYPEAVVTVAQTAGLSLIDDSEAAQASLKEKLDAIKTQVAPGTTVTSSNPPAQAPAETGRTEGLGRPKALGVDTGNVTVNPDPNLNKQYEYIRKLPAIDRMKRDAGIIQ